MIKQSPPAWLPKIISAPWMCPHPGSWSLAVAPPAWLMTQKSFPLISGGGEDTMWPNQSWLPSVKEIVCFINKFSMYFAVSDYINFLTCLLGWLVSWKWVGSVSILTFNHGNAHTRKMDRFFFAQAPCNQKKFSINKVYWLGKWVEPLSDEATHIGEIKKIDPLTKPALATRSVCPI